MSHDRATALRLGDRGSGTLSQKNFFLNIKIKNKQIKWEIWTESSTFKSWRLGEQKEERKEGNQQAKDEHGGSCHNPSTLGGPRGREFETSLANMVRPCLY